MQVYKPQSDKVIDDHDYSVFKEEMCFYCANLCTHFWYYRRHRVCIGVCGRHALSNTTWDTFTGPHYDDVVVVEMRPPTITLEVE